MGIKMDKFGWRYQEIYGFGFQPPYSDFFLPVVEINGQKSSSIVRTEYWSLNKSGVYFPKIISSDKKDFDFHKFSFLAQNSALRVILAGKFWKVWKTNVYECFGYSLS